MLRKSFILASIQMSCNVIKWYDNASEVKRFGLTKNDINMLAEIIKKMTGLHFLLQTKKIFGFIPKTFMEVMLY